MKLKKASVEPRSTRAGHVEPSFFRGLLPLGSAALGLAAFFPSDSAAQVVAGIDNWDNADAPTVTVLGEGIEATATSSGSGNGWNNTDNGGSGRGSSNDGTWGTFNIGTLPSTVSDVGVANITLPNGEESGEVTLTVTNNGTTDLALEAFRFDAVAFRPNAARAYALNVLPGSDITEGNVFTSEDDAITSVGGMLITDDTIDGVHDQHDDIDIDLTGLADSTLEVGGTAIIQIAFSSGTGSGGGHHLFLDNLALTTASDLVNTLVVTSVPTEAAAGEEFSVTVQAQNGSGSPINLVEDTVFSLSSSGVGTLSPTAGIIPAGMDSVTLNTVQSTSAEVITLTAVRTSGDAILPSDPSAPITITAADAASISIETAVDGTGDTVDATFLLAQGLLEVFAISRDAFGNFVANETTATFELVDLSGDVLATDLVDNLDGSATLNTGGLGTGVIRTSFGTLPDGDSGIITVEELTARWDRDSNASWGDATNWSHDTLPNFDNQTDIILYDPAADDEGFVSTFLSGERTLRSLSYTSDADANFNIRTTITGLTDAADLIFDTDSLTEPAAINIDADATGTFRVGNANNTATFTYGDIVLADNLLVNHNGTGVLNLDATVVETGGSFGITKEGSGTLLLSALPGANSYTGDTVVNDGVLQVTGVSLPDASTLVVAGGVVEVQADESVQGLVINGVTQPDGEYGSSESGVANPDDVNFSGPGIITVQPAPAEINIQVTNIERTGDEEFTLTFTSPVNVDVYFSETLDLSTFSFIDGNIPPGTYVDSNATLPVTFYILVPAGSQFP